MWVIREAIRFVTTFLQQIFSFLRFLKLDKLWGWLGKKTGRRLPGISLPAKAGWLTFLFLAICVGTFFWRRINRKTCRSGSCSAATTSR